MKERFFIFIKRKLPLIWRLIEEGNNMLLALLFGRKLKGIKEKYSNPVIFNNMKFRCLSRSDLVTLHSFLGGLDKKEFEFFKPHGFDSLSLERVLDKNIFLPFGVFDDNQLLGYCFLRLFFTRTAFFGNIVKPEYQGKKIGQTMGLFLHQIADEINFTLFSTISEKNTAALVSHRKNNNTLIVKKLQDNYVLVKFIHDK